MNTYTLTHTLTKEYFLLFESKSEKKKKKEEKEEKHINVQNIITHNQKERP